MTALENHHKGPVAEDPAGDTAGRIAQLRNTGLKVHAEGALKTPRDLIRGKPAPLTKGPALDPDDRPRDDDPF